ncbi:TrbI/VirB10 family protein [Vibrio cholerae]
MDETKLNRLRKGNIPSPNNTVKQVALGVAAALVGVVAIGGYAYFYYAQHVGQSNLPENTEFRETTSGDFFAGSIRQQRTEPSYISDFPTSQPSPPPQVEIKPLTSAGAFTPTERQIEQERQRVHNDEQKAARMNAIRYRHANAVADFHTGAPASSKTPALDSEALAQTKSVKTHDKDFSAHGIAKDVSTLPVDLTRTITADRYIACILNDQIHSQLAGQVTCQVENNIFGFHGRKILIPAGSRVIGFYEPISKTGMSRFPLQWKRIIRPDGVHIALTDAYASDQIGQAGVTGIIDNRFFDKYGAAIITASLSTAAQVTMNMRVEKNSTTQAVAENFGTDLGKVTAAMLEEVVNIKPFAVVPSGIRLFIRPQTDIWLQTTDNDQLVFGATNNKEVNNEH